MNGVDSPKQRDDESVSAFAKRISLLFLSEYGRCRSTAHSRRFRRNTKKAWLKAGVKHDILPFVWPRMLVNDDSIVWNDFVNSFQDAEWRYYIKHPKPLQDPVSKNNPHGLTVNSEGFVVVYTDGACSNNGRPNAKAGIGVWFGHDHELNVSKPLPWGMLPVTNNIAELAAVLRAISIVKGLGLRRLAIHSDSQYLKDSVESYIKRWLCNGWLLATGEPVKNKKFFRKYFRMAEDMSIKWVFVNRRRKIPGNVEADKMAKAGAKVYRRRPFI